MHMREARNILPIDSEAALIVYGYVGAGLGHTCGYSAQSSSVHGSPGLSY